MSCTAGHWTRIDYIVPANNADHCNSQGISALDDGTVVLVVIGWLDELVPAVRRSKQAVCTT